MTDAELDAIIARQQPRGALYPLESFCRACGTGHLALSKPGYGSCRKCERPMTDEVYRRHPDRLAGRK